MKPIIPLCVTAAGIIFGVATCGVFIYLTDQLKEKAETEKLHLNEINNKIKICENEAKQDSLAKCFESPDLQFHMLHGKVKSLNINGNLYTFNENGTWENQQSYETPTGYKATFNRDKFGYIISANSKEMIDGHSVESVKYKWTDNLLTKVSGIGYEWKYTIEYTYNSDKLVKYSIYKALDTSGESEIKSTYTYTDFDDHNNWTCRKVKQTITTIEHEGYFDDVTEEYVQNNNPIIDSQEFTETRTIKYYR